MKKTIFALVSVFFLAMVAGSVLADTTKPASTPAAKTMKHKTVRHKAGKKVAKKVEKQKKAATPSGKK